MKRGLIMSKKSIINVSTMIICIVFLISAISFMPFEVKAETSKI